MTGFVLHNVLAYSEQIAVLIGAAAILGKVLKMDAAARLRSLQLLLVCCAALPFAQPWRAPEINTAVTISTRTLGTTAGPANTPQYWIPSPAEAIGLLIAGGIVVRLALIGIGLFRLKRYTENARFAPDAFPVEKERTGVWPDIFISEELKGPVTFGLFRPVILIPARWMHNETVAYHELVHVRRKDWAFTVVEELVRALLWFHPCVWWLIGQIQLAREEVVDRAAIQLTESREQYLDTLLAIAEARAGLDLAPAPLFLKKRHLRQRVAALIQEVNMSKIRVRTSLAFFVAMVGACAWMATHSFPLQAAPQAVKDSPGVLVQQDDSKLLHRAPVVYPREAIDKGVQGAVVLELTLNDKGEVVDAQVLNGPMELRRAALESALKWHYNKDAGVPAKVQVTINFVLPASREHGSMTPAPPPDAMSTIARIDLSLLPEPLRGKVASQLPVHEGEQLTQSNTEQMFAALAGIDAHLKAALVPLPDGRGSIITIALENQLKGAEPATPQRIRVGGNVQAINLINKVTPAYPPEAKQARIQGVVRFTATIGKDGHIMSLQLISGHPLLAQAAEDAVKQWVYKPTLLNGDPVEVITQIDVNFTLRDTPPAAAQPQL